jgi:hypothetical protein
MLAGQPPQWSEIMLWRFSDKTRFVALVGCLAFTFINGAAGLAQQSPTLTKPPGNQQPTKAADATTMADLKIEWKNRFLQIKGNFPGDELSVNYLEAYCRAGSTDRDWGETVIPHESELVSASADGKRIELRDRLKDGVIVKHVITAANDEIEFQVTATNLTSQASEAHWAQPCIRVDKFVGAAKQGARDRVPEYAKKCFLYIDGQLTRLPTTPWADQARYVYGQVYVPAGVNRNDVNPRPLSELVPSNGLCGCFSQNEKQILAVAWEPYQEIFQGVITCIHSDFRIGGLQPGETKKIRGKIYVVDNDSAALLKRYQNDFPQSAQPGN